MIKKILFPFSKLYSDLHKKWWHRFFVVLFSITIFGFLIIAFVVSFGTMPENTKSITIINNLRDYTKNSDSKVINTIPQFLDQNGKYGCLRDNKVDYLFTYSLEEKSLCNSDIFSNLDEVTRTFNTYAEYKNLSFDELKKSVLEHLSENGEKRYCFINNDLNCSSDNIINYIPNWFYYLQAIIYPLLATYLFSIILQLSYFKAFIYIVYGKK